MIGSVTTIMGLPDVAAYATTKTALHGLTRSMAIELGKYSINVNCICPGFIKTAHGIRELKELRNYGVNVTEEDICRLQGRICEPEEVANAALFLASSESSFVNGETLFVDNAMLVQT